MVNIAVLVSGSGSNLQALIDNCLNHNIDGEIKVVISNRQKAYGLQRAKDAGIKALWIKDQKELLAKIKEEKIELIVLAGYLAIIDDELIKEYDGRIINIHPSLIPSFCGKGYYGIHVHEAAFKRGVKVSGATVHFVSNVVDGGPIIIQEAIDVSDCDTPEAMQMKVLKIEHQILPKAVKLFCENRLEIKDERVIIK